MPSFTITIDENTYEITIPSPEYVIPDEVMEHSDDMPMFFEENTTDIIITNSRLFNRDVMDAYEQYVISKGWNEEECGEVKDLIKVYDTIMGECEEYLDGYVEWGDVWTEKVRDEMPDHAKFDDDEVILGLVRIVNEVKEKREEKRKEAQRQENKAVLERKIAERKEALAKLQREMEEMEALKNQYE